MKKPSSNLSIRVELDDEERFRVREEVIYRWDRIFAAVAAVVVVLGLGITGWYWLQGSGSESSAEPVATGPVNNGADPAPSRDAQAASPTVDPGPETPAAAVATNEAELVPPPAQQVTSEPIPVTPEEKPAQEALTLDESMPTEPTAAGEAAEPDAEVPVVADAPEPEPAPDPVITAPEPQPETATAAPAAAPTEVLNLSPHLVRAQLSSDLKDREPVDVLPERIPMNEQGLLRVYFFTEMQGLKGQTVYHDWYLDGERRARVTIRPHLDTMRASSSKFIDRHMLGEWQVKVHTEEGEDLARAAFEAYQ